MSKPQTVPVQLPAMVLTQMTKFAEGMHLDLNECVKQALLNWLNDIARPMAEELIAQGEAEIDAQEALLRAALAEIGTGLDMATFGLIEGTGISLRDTLTAALIYFHNYGSDEFRKNPRSLKFRHCMASHQRVESRAGSFDLKDELCQ